MGVTGMLVVARGVQIPLLAVLLIGGCVAKGRRAVGARSIDAAAGPTAMFPLPLRRPAAIAICASEFALGVGLFVTAGRLGAGWPEIAVRVAAALLFWTAVAALYLLRVRRPNEGCGCFGELSSTPVSWRTMTRAALLGVAALTTIAAPPLHMPTSIGQAAEVLVLDVVELALVAVLSPEIGQVMVRLGHAEPCELRRVPVTRTLATLRASAAWRHYRPHLISSTPTDVWREGCWRFAAYPGVLVSRRVEVVFAVYLTGRRAPVRAGVLAVDSPPPIPTTLSHRYSSLTVYTKNSIPMNKINIPSNGPRLLSSRPLDRPAVPVNLRSYTGWERRNLPKCGTVKAMRPRSEL